MVSINHFVLIAAFALVSSASSNLPRFRSSAGAPKVISQFSDNYVSSGQRLCLGSDNILFAAQTFQNVSGSTGGLFSSYYGGNFSAASADYFYTVPSEYKMKGAFCGQSGSNAMSYVLTQYDIDLQHSSYMIFVIDPVTGSLLKTVTYDTSNQAGNDRVINPVHLTVDRLTGDIYVLGTNNNFQYVVTRHPGGGNNTVVAFFQIDDAAQIPTQLRTSPLAADAGIVFVLGGAQRTSVNGVAVKGVQNVFVARMNMKTPTELGITTSTTTTTTADTTSETTTTTTTTTTMLTTLMSANSTVSTVHVNMSSTFSTASLEVSTSSTESTTTTTDEATTASSSPSPVVQEFSGKPDWTFVFGTDDLDQNVGFDTPTGMSVSSDGKSLFVYGYSFGNLSSNYTNKGFQDLFVTRLSINDTGAELTWTAMYGTQFSEFLTTGTLDSSRGILHVGGNAKSPLFSGLPFYGERDMFIMSLNTTDGSVLDVWQWGLPKPFESFTRELRVDSTNGVLYVFGQSEGQLFSINKNAWGNSTSFIARIGPIIVPSSTTISAQSSLPTASLNATLTITETLSVSQVSATSTPTQTNGPIIDGNALLGALLGIWASFQWAVIAVGVVIVLLLALAIYCCCFRKRKQAKAPESFDFKPPVPVASVRGTSQVPSAEGKSDLNRRASVSSRFNADSSASISQQQQQPDLFGDKFAAGSSQAMGSSSAVQRNASVRRQMSTRQTADISTAFGSIPQPNVMGSSFSNSNNFDMMASSQTGKAKVDDLDALADELQNKFDF